MYLSLFHRPTTGCQNKPEKSFMTLLLCKLIIKRETVRKMIHEKSIRYPFSYSREGTESTTPYRQINHIEMNSVTQLFRWRMSCANVRKQDSDIFDLFFYYQSNVKLLDNLSHVIRTDKRRQGVTIQIDSFLCYKYCLHGK